MTRKQKHLLTRILVAAVLFLAGSLLHLPEYVEMGVFLVCYAVVGWDIVWKAITNILHTLSWEHRGITHTVMGNIPYDEIMKIAEGIR